MSVREKFREQPDIATALADLRKALDAKILEAERDVVAMKQVEALPESKLRSPYDDIVLAQLEINEKRLAWLTHARDAIGGSGLRDTVATDQREERAARAREAGMLLGVALGPIFLLIVSIEAIAWILRGFLGTR